MTDQDIWDKDFFNRSPIYWPLQPLVRHFEQHEQWPNINDYARLFKQKNMPVIPVPQAQQITRYEDQYEPRVYLKKELQTRTENWHDFFNALVWLSFPQTKSALNRLHYQQSQQRQPGSNRSLLENRITQFDECGALIISDKPELLQLIREHNWIELFIQQRELFKQHIRCIVFGHAIYEKALAPYIGMTCHGILVESKDLLANANNLELIDEYLSQHWVDVLQENPQKLQAFPILGIPGFWPIQDERFYKNEGYFRKPRKMNNLQR